jgi:hypothetical protein
MSDDTPSYEAADDDGVCARCGIRSATSAHECPFKTEVHDDFTTRCTCCTACTQECADDV